LAQVGEESVPYLLANSFVVVCIAGLAASYRQYKMKNFFLKDAAITAFPATLVSIFIIFLISTLLKTEGEYLKPIFKGVFLCILIFIVVQSFVSKKSNAYNKRPDEISNQKKSLAGVIVGFFSGITGLGGGSIMLPLFHNIFQLKYSIATSISSTVIPLFILPSLIYYSLLSPTRLINSGMQTGYICWHLVLPMVPFIIIFSQIGVKMNHKFPLWLTKIIFVVIIIINIVKILFL